MPLDHGSVGGPFQILNDFKTRVNTPLTTRERGDSRLLGETREGGVTSQTSSVFGLGAFSKHLPSRGGSVDKDDISKGYDVARGWILSSVGGVGAGDQVRQDGRCLVAHQDPVSLDLYGPHGIRDTICGGTIARGFQGQLPDRVLFEKGVSVHDPRGQVKFGTAAAWGLLCQGE